MKQYATIEECIDLKDEIITLYFKDIAKYRPLNAVEEAQLAEKIKEGDKAAIHKLVKSNLRFVVSVARKYQAQGVELIDLINIGNIGLIKAAIRFDEKKNFKFISYAVWWIRQAILQALADQSRLFRIPINRIADIYKVRKTTDQLVQRYQRYPQNEEIAGNSGMKEELVYSSQYIAQNYISLDAPVGTDSDIPISAQVEDSKSELPDTNLVIKSFQKKIVESLGFLDKREKEIIILYFGLDGENAYTLDEIGRRFVLTRERVRQLRDKALLTLRKNGKLKSLFIDYFSN